CLGKKEESMKKLIGIVLLGTVINSAHAQEFLEFGVEDYQAKESKWQFDVGINYLQYPTNLPDFKGEYYTNREVENFEVYGPSIGFGRDFHIVAGLSVSAKAGGFFYWTFNN